jgi:hypothetical protein
MTCWRNRPGLVIVAGLTFGAFATAPLAFADESNLPPSAEDLAKLKQNPLSGLREIIFQAEVSPNVPGSGKTFGSYSVQPVWPFSLSNDWKVSPTRFCRFYRCPCPAKTSRWD